MEIDRLKELEKLAKKLGIGIKKEVICFSCEKKIKLSKAIVLTNKKKVTYLCGKCYAELEAGKLKESEMDDVLKQIEKIRKETPPKPYTDDRWKYIPDKSTYDRGIKTGDYTCEASFKASLLKNSDTLVYKLEDIKWL